MGSTSDPHVVRVIPGCGFPTESWGYAEGAKRDNASGPGFRALATAGAVAVYWFAGSEGESAPDDARAQRG